MTYLCNGCHPDGDDGSRDSTEGKTCPGTSELCSQTSKGLWLVPSHATVQSVFKNWLVVHVRAGIYGTFLLVIS